MASERYVLLGLARARAPWFSDVARWATSGAVAVDFVKAVSLDEVRARLGSGRRFSALLLDGGVPSIDRDLVELVAQQGCALVIVGGPQRDWLTGDVAATLPDEFDQRQLEAVLATHAVPVSRADDLPGLVRAMEDTAPGFRARTVAVTGPGGTGRSVVAAALAQGFAADVAHADAVLLADLALHADQAMLHDVRDVIPGLLELVEGHRAGELSVAAVRNLTFEIVERHYRLLLGLRQHRDWTALRPRALRTALDALRRTFTLVVADIGDDLEDERLTGSADVEDRNLLARSTISMADVVVIVGTPGMKGAHSLLRVMRDVLGAGIDPARLVPVLNRAPRRPAARRELRQTLGELVKATDGDGQILSPVFLPERRNLDDILRDGTALPSALVHPVTDAVAHRLRALTDEPATDLEDAPVPVAIGSLGAWGEDEAAG